jgi:hypothetical protein
MQPEPGPVIKSRYLVATFVRSGYLEAQAVKTDLFLILLLKK